MDPLIEERDGAVTTLSINDAIFIELSKSGYNTLTRQSRYCCGSNGEIDVIEIVAA